MKNAFLLFALLISSVSFSQSVVGKYKLKYTCYKNDTVEAADTNATKTFSYKVAKGQHPEMTQADSAGNVAMVMFGIALFEQLTLNMKDNGEYWLIGFMGDADGYKNGTYKVKKGVLTVTTKSGKEEVYSIETVRGHQYITRSKNGLSYMFELQ
jgi:hypothetical protein